jgi:hypothetical protein
MTMIHPDIMKVLADLGHAWDEALAQVPDDVFQTYDLMFHLSVKSYGEPFATYYEEGLC